MSESGPEASEPVDPKKTEAPAVADADTAVKTEAPVAAEALPTASKKTERKISRMEDKADMDRKLMRTKIDEMDRTILDLQSQIDKEEDTGKQAKMRDKLADKVADREAVYAEYKTMTAELDAKTEAIRKELDKIQLSKDEIAGLEAFIEANKGTLDKDRILLLADKTRTLNDKEVEFKKMCPEGHEDDLKATLKAYEAEQLHIKEEAERRDEIGEADRTLERDMAIALGDTPPPGPEPEPEPKKTEDEKKPDEKKGDKAPLTKEEKEVILDNRIDQIAFNLAKMLAGNVPKDNDTIGKYTFEAKRGLLMVMTFLGGDPVWTEQLTPDEKKNLGMTVTTKLDDEGQTLHMIKWEPLDLSGNNIQDVYEAAFGKEGWSKQMALLTPTTTVKELQDKVAAFPKDTTDPEQQNMIKFVDALVSSGAKPESGVQEYIIKNGDKVIKILKPETATASGAAPEAKAPESKIKASDFTEIIEKNKFNESTKAVEVAKALYPDQEDIPALTADQIPGAAKAQVDTLTSETSITAFSENFRSSAKALATMGIGADISRSLDTTFSNALKEIKTGQLSDKTKAELQTGIEASLTIQQKVKDLTFKVFLEKQRQNSTDDIEKKDIDILLTALKANNPTEATPAPAK